MDVHDHRLVQNGLAVRDTRAEVLEALERLSAAGARSAEPQLPAEMLARIAEAGRGSSPV